MTGLDRTKNGKAGFYYLIRELRFTAKSKLIFQVHLIQIDVGIMLLFTGYFKKFFFKLQNVLLIVDIESGLVKIKNAKMSMNVYYLRL